MKTTLDIFISSKMLELKPERDALFDLLPTLDYGDIELRAWVFEEDAPASDRPIRDIYLDALKDSALYIGLFWNQYGEWTIDEFDRATEWGMERHIYVKDVDAKKRDPKLSEFLEKHGDVRAGITAKWFKTTEELRNAVEASIQKWVIHRLKRPTGATYAVTATFATLPNHIPEQPEQLIGRDKLQEDVEALLKGGERVLLQGFGGMGKTALAAEIATKWVSQKGPALWMKAGQNTTDALFEGLARTFGEDVVKGVAAAQGEAKIAVLHRILEQSKVSLLIIDDAWEAETFAPVLKAVPSNIQILVTSRNKLWGRALVEVGKLDPDESIKVLEYYADQSYETDEHATKICEALGHHALALKIAGDMLAVDTITPAEMLSKYENALHSLEMPSEEEGHRSVAAVIKTSLEALKVKGDKGDLAYKIFLAFGAFFVPSATPELLRFYMQTGIGAKLPLLVKPREIEDALTTLSRRGLAEKVAATKKIIANYHIHDLAYSYTRAHATENDIRRAITACLTLSEKYNNPSLESFKYLRPEVDNLVSAAVTAFDLGHYQPGRQLVVNLATSGGSQVLDYLGFYTQSVVLLTQAVKVAHTLGLRSDESVSLGNLGIAYRSLGQYVRALELHQQALDLCREIGDHRGEGQELGNIGLAHFFLGEYERSIEYCLQGLKISRETGHRQDQSGHLGNLGLAYAALEQSEEAIEHFQQALVISREIGDRRGEGNHLSGLGGVFLREGQNHKAIEYLQEGLSISREIGDRRSEGTRLGNLGLAYAGLGQREKAIEFYEEALVINREIGDRHGAGNQIANLGIAYAELEHYERAISYFQEARAIFVDIAVPPMVKRMDHNIAIALAAMSEQTDD